jgi:hypothetical protein
MEEAKHGKTLTSTQKRRQTPSDSIMEYRRKGKEPLGGATDTFRLGLELGLEVIIYN